jgi:hypothetical protein
MMRFFLIIIYFQISFKSFAQELFVFTEPASNMPAKSIGLRLLNSFMGNDDNTINYHVMPEVMVGVNKKLMLHGQAFLSNRNNGLVAEGGSFYAKYRWLTIENVHRHFRMASFGRYSFNNSDIHQEEIETVGHNSGYEVGMIATQLIHKYAFNSTLSFEQAMNNTVANKFPVNQSNQAINYTFSLGKLLLPKEYTNYNQTNLNFMIEFLGQKLLANSKSYLDIAPSFQFIFNSVARLDIAYRHEIYSNMLRTAPNGVLIKFEYNFFNVLK